MSARLERNTAYFTSADWRALVANHIAIKKPGGTSRFTIHHEGLVETLTAAMIAAPECSTMDDVIEHGYALDHLVHNVVGLPVDDSRKMPTDPLELRDYVDPVEGLGSIIQGRMGGRYDHAVQRNLVLKGKFLISTTVPRDYTSKATGITTKQKVRVWAVAVSAELIDRLVLEPEVKRVWQASVHAANNARARMTAVPESTPMVLAALDAEIVATSNARATAYAAAIDGKSSKEVAALDAAISDLTDNKVKHQQAAITGGVDDVDAD